MSEHQISLLPIGQYGSDVVMTPDALAAGIVKHFNPSGVCLDPCRGDGAFYRHLPPGALWCEITEGVDLFQFGTPVDWIIGNPPYAVFSQWLRHSFTLARDIVYLIPVNKVFNSFTMLKDIHAWGGIREIVAIAAGSTLKFPIGFAVGAIHLQREWTGETRIVVEDPR